MFKTTAANHRHKTLLKLLVFISVIIGSTPSGIEPNAPLLLNGDSTLVAAVGSELVKISALNGSRTDVLFDGGVLAAWNFLSPVDVV